MTTSDLPDGMCEKAIRISNENGELDLIVLEPWGEEVDVQPGDIVDISASGPSEDALLETEGIEKGIVVWAWPGSLLEVRLNGKPVETASSKIAPPRLSGGSIKKLLTLTKLISDPYTRPKRS